MDQKVITIINECGVEVQSVIRRDVKNINPHSRICYDGMETGVRRKLESWVLATILSEIVAMMV